ncbi:MAG: bacillithiol biosynthesis cysteine-adding enzyme BshC, partial [Bacteroidia bacterium]
MNFTTAKLPLAATNQFSQLFLDYVSAATQLQSFYSYAPDEDGCVKAASELSYNELNRNVLVAEITRQYADGSATLPKALIETLAIPGTYTICTGHQLVLFGGPLFFVYKIITTIKAATTVSARLQHPVVPVFWMASEDHDIDEIRSVSLYGKTLSWNETGGGAVGQLRTDSLEPLLAELEQVLGTAPGAPELAAQLREVYAPGQSLADATRRFVHLLFGDRVLVLDADSAALKRLFLPQLRAELETGIAQTLVTESIAALEKNGYSAQVNPRAINLFYLGKNTRERIDRSGDKFLLTGSAQTIERNTLLAELEQHPERFSPNVVLRPLYQQCILPNIAYVGGPGEIAYWLEFRSFFEAQKTNFPVLLPRAFALVVDKGTATKLAKLQVQLPELFEHVDTLLSNYVKRTAGAELSFE